MEILKSEQYINEKLDIKPVTTDRLVDWVKVKDFIKKNNLKWNPTTKGMIVREMLKYMAI